MNDAPPAYNDYDYNAPPAYDVGSVEVNAGVVSQAHAQANEHISQVQQSPYNNDPYARPANMNNNGQMPPNMNNNNNNYDNYDNYDPYMQQQQQQGPPSQHQSRPQSRPQSHSYHKRMHQHQQQPSPQPGPGPYPPQQQPYQQQPYQQQPQPYQQQPGPGPYGQPSGPQMQDNLPPDVAQFNNMNSFGGQVPAMDGQYQNQSNNPTMGPNMNPNMNPNNMNPNNMNQSPPRQGGPGPQGGPQMGYGHPPSNENYSQQMTGGAPTSIAGGSQYGGPPDDYEVQYDDQTQSRNSYGGPPQPMGQDQMRMQYGGPQGGPQGPGPQMVPVTMPDGSIQYRPVTPQQGPYGGPAPSQYGGSQYAPSQYGGGSQYGGPPPSQYGGGPTASQYPNTNLPPEQTEEQVAEWRAKKKKQAVYAAVFGIFLTVIGLIWNITWLIVIGIIIAIGGAFQAKRMSVPVNQPNGVQTQTYTQ